MNSWAAWTCLAYLIGLSFNAVTAWPVGYGRDDDREYPALAGRNTDDQGSDWSNGDLEDGGLLPQLTLEELKTLMEMAGSEARDGQQQDELPVANFSPLGPDPTDNGGAGPFKFVKPTPASTEVVVQTRSPSLVKKHIATISDETPLYLNYAEKEDGVPHRPVGLQGQPKPSSGLLDETMVLLPEVNTKPDFEEQDMASEKESARAETNDDNDNDMESQDASIPNRPEIDFTQRLTFPDLSGMDVETARLTAGEETEGSQEDAAAAVDEKETEEDTAADETPAGQEAETEDSQDSNPPASLISSQPIPVPAVSEPVNGPLVVHVVSAPSPQHLAKPNDLSFIPSPEYGFFLKTVGEKRAQESAATSSNSVTSSLTLYIVFACTGAALFGVVAAAYIHRRGSRKNTMSDAEEPAYGVTGPGPIKPTFLDLSGDRSLAKSAETYHYQHQKRQILSSVENNPSSGGSTATPRSGDHSDYDSDEDEEEGEDYGDYTVYECPGLAPPGEIEVLNPMFAGAGNKDSTASNVNEE